jgi:hypothetical protein
MRREHVAMISGTALTVMITDLASAAYDLRTRLVFR